jgi:hypothetical protein
VPASFNGREPALNGVASAELANVARVAANIAALTDLAKGFMIISHR